MRRSHLAVVALTALWCPLSAFATTVTVRSGETLSEIADRYNVSVRDLMRLNSINSSDHIEVGSRLRVRDLRTKAGKGMHYIQRGETLNTIAARYKVSKWDLIMLNSLNNANHLEVGQSLKLPSNAVLPKSSFKPVAVKPVLGATEHIVAKGQTLTQIAKAYKIPIATLININELTNPNEITVGTRLYLKQHSTPLVTKGITSEALSMQTKPMVNRPVETKANVEKPAAAVTRTTKTQLAKSTDWRTYGPLQVDWANWQLMGDSQVVPALNAQDQAFYLAVNCFAKKINATESNGSWKVWINPQNRFEKALVKDRCQLKV
ncbi:LysM peptidoglycan-binding domain-containing protein [Synechococcus sp. M16CYN]|uniref:muramidase family protein n=1 Tax=Synechococcus sp. M16CYN TaxID=3103139 RepID=UPI0032531D90